MFTYKHQVVSIMNTQFCVKRIIYAFFTVFFNSLVLLTVFVKLIFTTFTFGFYIREKPMNTKLFNFMENFNEFNIYFFTYFMLIFSDFVPDVELRY